VLIINDNDKQKIKKLIDFSFNHIISFEEVLLMAEGNLAPVRYDSNYVIEISDIFRVVFSIEHQKKFLTRHISISVYNMTKVPDDEDVKIIIKEFGFTNLGTPIINRSIYEEPFSCAINIIEEIV
jgi:hypothetical protein